MSALSVSDLCRALCLAIEEAGASPQLTKCSVLAAGLQKRLVEPDVKPCDVEPYDELSADGLRITTHHGDGTTSVLDLDSRTESSYLSEKHRYTITDEHSSIRIKPGGGKGHCVLYANSGDGVTQKTIGALRQLMADNKRLHKQIVESGRAQPIGWLVIDADGAPQFVADTKQSAHEHITDCLHGGYPEAAKFVVRPAYGHAA